MTKGQFFAFGARNLLAGALVSGVLTTSGCATDAGPLERVKDTAPVPASRGEPALIDSSPKSTLSSMSLQQSLLVSPRPPEVVANRLSELADTVGYSARATDGGLSKQRGARWREAAQIGLLVGSPEGKAFLSAERGRALVRGEPALSCPSLNVASAPTDDLAVEGALRACLSTLATRDNCGCRVIARGDKLLAPQKDFSYAIGVGTTLIDPSTNSSLRLSSEERLVQGRSGARHVWILGITGPFALLQVEQDGRAALVITESGERYTGIHRIEGFRRGRVARRAYLDGPNGKRLIVLVGFEDTELSDNREALMSWNTGSIQLIAASDDKDDDKAVQ